MTTEDRVARAVTWLLTESHLMRPQALPTAADEAAHRAGALGCRVHLISRDQRSLVPLPGPGGSHDGEPLTVDGTLAGRAYRDTEAMTGAGGTRLWLPLLNGTERLGVLELLVQPGDAAALSSTATPLASLVAELWSARASTATPSSGPAGRCRWASRPRCSGASSRR